MGRALKPYTTTRIAPAPRSAELQFGALAFGHFVPVNVGPLNRGKGRQGNCMGQAGVWLVAGRASRLRSRARLRFVPEARKKLAGGEAQRNRRKTRTEVRCAPAGRERRAPRRPASPGRRVIMGRPPGPSATQRPRTNGRGGAISRFSRPAGAQGRVWGGGSGGSATLHHRLISYVPPARRGGKAGRTTGTEGKCANSKHPAEAGC